MKLKQLLVPILFFSCSFSSFAQEKFGKAINIGIGGTYYGYVGHPTPVVMLNYEIDLVKNVTLAPFIGFYSYTKHYDNWYHPGHGPYKHNYPYHGSYSYRQTVVPIGVKGTYYFDELLKANKDWDFYASLSLGFAIRNTNWDDDYYDDYYTTKGSSLYADLHIGAEYHINQTLGVYADASLGMFLVGLAVHHK